MDDLKGGGVRKDGSWVTELSRTERSVALLPPSEGLASGEDRVLLGDGRGRGSMGAVWPMGELSIASRIGSNAGIAVDSVQHSNKFNSRRPDARARRHLRRW